MKDCEGFRFRRRLLGLSLLWFRWHGERYSTRKLTVWGRGSEPELPLTWDFLYIHP